MKNDIFWGMKITQILNCRTLLLVSFGFIACSMEAGGAATEMSDPAEKLHGDSVGGKK